MRPRIRRPEFSLKRYAHGFALAICIAAISIPLTRLGAQIPGSPAGYVTDLAEVLSDDEIESLEATLGEFERESSNQIFVLIAPDLGGRDEFTVTFETASRWGVGQAGKDNGVLIALYMADRKIRIEVGYGLEGSVPDAFASRIIRGVMVPHMRDGSPYLAIEGAVQEIMAASRGEYDADELAGSAGELYEAFNYGYIPDWAESTVVVLALVYGAVSLLYSIFGGITAKFDSASKRFDVVFDVIEFLSDLIATQLLVAVLAGLPVYFLMFIVEEFHVHAYGLLLIAPIVVILFFLHAMLRGPRDLRRQIREKTENLNAWRKLAKEYDGEQIEELRAYFQSRLKRWRPASMLRTAYEALDKHVDRALKHPEKYFAYNAEFARTEIERLLDGDALRRKLSDTFVSEEVDLKFEKLAARRERLFAKNVYDAAAGDKLLKDLRQISEKPEDHFEYSLPAVTAKILDLTDNAALWSRWRMRDNYIKSRVNRKEKGLHRQFADLQKIADADERRTKLNVFYKNQIEPVRSNPGRFFKRPERTRSSRSYSSSSYTSYSSGSSSYTSSSSGSFSGGFSGGGGGSFGGGGASGSW